MPARAGGLRRRGGRTRGRLRAPGALAVERGKVSEGHTGGRDQKWMAENGWQKLQVLCHLAFRLFALGDGGLIIRHLVFPACG